MPNTNPDQNALSPLASFLARDDSGTIIKLIAAALVLAASTVFISIAVTEYQDEARIQLFDRELGITTEVKDAHEQATLAAEQMEYLSTLSAPVWACYGTRGSNSSANDQWFFTEDADLRPWNSQDCSRIWTDPVTMNSLEGTDEYRAELDSLYTRTGTPLDRGAVFREQGFKNAAEYASYHFGTQLEGQWPMEEVVQATDESDSAFYDRQQYNATVRDFATICLITNFLENTEYAYTPKP